MGSGGYWPHGTVTKAEVTEEEAIGCWWGQHHFSPLRKEGPS